MHTPDWRECHCQVLAAEAMRHAHMLLPSLLDADSPASCDRLHLALAALLRVRRDVGPTAPLGAGEALALPSKRYNMVSRCGLASWLMCKLIGLQSDPNQTLTCGEGQAPGMRAEHTVPGCRRTPDVAQWCALLLTRAHVKHVLCEYLHTA